MVQIVEPLRPRAGSLLVEIGDGGAVGLSVPTSGGPLRAPAWSERYKRELLIEPSSVGCKEQSTVVFGMGTHTMTY